MAILRRVAQARPASRRPRPNAWAATTCCLLLLASSLLSLPPSVEAGSLTGITVSAGANTKAGQYATYTITFTTVAEWPPAGSIEVEFPQGYDVRFAGTGSVTSSQGIPNVCVTAAKPVEVIGNKVRLLRNTGDTTCPAGTGVSVTFTSLRNPRVEGTFTPIAVRTYDATNAPLDSGQGSFNVAKAVMAGAFAAPVNPTGGGTTLLRLVFFTSNPWPKNGRASITASSSTIGLPTSPTITTQGCTSGGFGASKTSETNLEITRDGTGADCPPGLVVLEIPGVQMPTSTGNTVSVATKNGTGATIDEKTNLPLKPSPALTSLDAVPTDPHVGAKTTYTFSFTSPVDWPNNGKIVFQFPVGYTVDTEPTAGTITAGGNCVNPGGFRPTGNLPTWSATDYTLTLTRNSTGAQAGSTCLAGPMTVSVPGVTNPAFVQQHPIRVDLHSSSLTVPIASGTSFVTSLTPVELQDKSVSPATTIVGNRPTFTFGFSSTAPWPAEGRIRFTFPESFDLSLVPSGTKSSGTGCNGGYSLQADDTAKTLVVLRNGAGTNCTVPATVSGITGIRNSLSAGTHPINGQLEAASGRIIAQGSYTVSLVAGTLTPPTGKPFVNVTEPRAGKLSSYWFNFSSDATWTPDGLFVAKFPSNFGLPEETSATIAGCGPNPEAAVAYSLPATSEVVVPRPGTADDCVAGNATRITVNGIRNPPESGTSIPFPADAFRIITANDETLAMDVGTRTIGLLPSALVSATLTPLVNTPSAVTNYHVSVETSTLWPADARLAFYFPSAFGTVTVPVGIQAPVANCTTGQFFIQRPSNMVSIVRSGGSDCRSGLRLEADLPSVGNPQIAGSFPVPIKTVTSAGATIDEGTATVVIVPRTSDSATVQPLAPVVGQTQVKYQFTFRPKATWPADGKLTLSFPAAFTVPAGNSGVSGGVADGATKPRAGELTGDCTGKYDVTSASQVVTVTRYGTGTGCGSYATPPSVTVNLTKIGNPTYAGSFPIPFSMRNQASTVIEQGTVNAVIVPAVMTTASATAVQKAAGETTTYSLKFTVTPASTGGGGSQWLAGGSILVTVPNDQILVNPTVGLLPPSGCTSGSTFSLVTTANTVLLQRNGGSNCDGAFTMDITGVRNPQHAGTTQPILLTTRNANGYPMSAASMTANIGWAANLTDYHMAVDNLHAGALGAYSFNFTNRNPWPATGRLVATFPSNVDLLSLGPTATGTPCGGSYNVARFGQTVVVTRSGGSDCPAGTVINVTLANVKNAPRTGTISLPFKTQNAQLLDIDTATAPVNIINGTLGSLLVTPTSQLAGADTTYRLQFNPANPWPQGGRLVVTFPNGYKFGPTVGIQTVSGCTSSWGTPTVNQATRQVTILRTGTGACASSLTLDLTHIVNPGQQTAANPILVETFSADTTPVLLDRASVPLAILAANLGLTAQGGSTLAGATTTYQLRFQNSVNASWPADGRLRVQFPTGFVLQADAIATAGCTSGAFTISLSASNVAHVDRSGTGAAACTGNAGFDFRNVRNALDSDQDGAVEVRTQTKNGVETIGVGVANVAVDPAGNLQNTATVPTNGTVDQPLPLQFKFRLATAWPTSGRFVAELPTGFVVTSPTATADVCGPFTAAAAGTTVTVTRLDSSSCPAATLVTLTIQGIRLPTTTMTVQIPIKTVSVAGADLDIGLVAFTVSPGPINPARSTITAVPTSIIADGDATAALTMQLRDQFDNNILHNAGIGQMKPSAGTLPGSTFNGEFYTVAYNTNGYYTATYRAPTQAGTATVIGKVGTKTLTTPASITLVPGPASGAKSLVTVDPLSILADGTTEATVTVRLKDQFENLLTSSGGVVSLSTDQGTLVPDLDNQVVRDNLDGTYSATLRSSTIAGQATISGSVIPLGSTTPQSFTTPATATFHAGPARHLFPSPAGSFDTNGVTAGDNHALSVRVTDLHGNPVAGAQITWAVMNANGTLTSTQSTSGSDGIASTVLETDDVIGEHKVRATSVASLVGSPLTFTVNTVAGPAAKIAADGPTTFSGLLAGDTQALRVKVRDAHDNVVPGASIAWTVTQKAGTLSSALSTSGASGVATTTLTTDSVNGTNKVGASPDGVPTAVVTFIVDTIAGPVSPPDSAITVNNATIVANDVTTSIVTVRLNDQYGNLAKLASGLPTMTASLGTMGAVTKVSDGIYRATLTAGKVAGTSHVRAFLGTEEIGEGTTVTLLAGAPVSMAAVSDTEETDIPVGSARDLQVRVLDANGNPCEGIWVHWTTSGGTVSVPKSQTNAQGIANATFTTGNQPGTNDAFAANQTLTVNKTRQFRIVTVIGVPARMIASGANSFPAVAAGASQPFAVKVVDAKDNGIPNINVTWAIVSGPGNLSKNWSITGASGIGAVNLLTSTTTGTTNVSATFPEIAAQVFFLTVTKPTYSVVAQGTLPTNLGVANATSVKVIVKDQKGTAVAGVRIAWTVSAGGGSVSPTSSLTGADGVASTNLTAGITVGTNTVVATNATLTGSPLSLSLTTVPGAPAALRWSGVPATARTDSTFSAAIEVIDQHGNVVPATGSALLTLGAGPVGELKGPTSTALANGKGTFAGLRLATAGTYRLLATHKQFQETTTSILVTSPPAATTPTSAAATSTSNAQEVPASVAAFFVPDVEARRLVNGTVEVTWPKPPVEGINGFLLWRASSPFTLVGELNSTTLRFLDADVANDRSYRYAVTYFLAAGAGYGEVRATMEGLARDASMPASADVDEQSKAKAFVGTLSEFPVYAYVGIGAVVAVAALAATAIVIRRRASRQSAFVVVSRGSGNHRATTPTPAKPPAQRIRVPASHGAPAWRTSARNRR